METPIPSFSIPACLALSLAACSSPKNDLDDFVEHVAPQCEFFQDSLRAALYPDYPSNPSLLSEAMRANVRTGAQVFRLRYVPNLSDTESDSFLRDFSNYLSSTSDVVQVCKIPADLRVVVDFVDAFALDHPDYLKGVTLPEYPLGPYDPARFSTIPLWKMQGTGLLFNNTFRYDDFLQTKALHAKALHATELHADHGSFRYNSPTSGTTYEFLFLNSSHCSPFPDTECPSTVVFGRTNEADAFSLKVGIDGVKAFLTARDECNAACLAH